MDRRKAAACAIIALTGHVGAAPAVADAFSAYSLSGSFSLPAGASSYDILTDGRVVSMVGAEVLVETSVGGGSYSSLGALPGADIGSGSFATAFVRVSPDGTRIAVGNNGGTSFSNFEVGVFNLTGLAGDWFATDHFEAEWMDNDHVAMTTFGAVTLLDTTSDPLSPVIDVLVDNIGGFSGGVTFDPDGRLYTANGFDGAGPSDTGWIKAFDAPSPRSGIADPYDFEKEGTLVADVLSGFTLGFDADGNLHVGGGDLFGGSGDNNYAGLIHHAALQSALDGFGPIDPDDGAELRRFDPNANPDSNYDVNYNPVTADLLLRDGETVYTFAVPEPGTLSIVATISIIGLMTGGRARRVRG